MSPPALAADLTRPSTLDALRRPRIAPHSDHCVRVARGSLHAQHSELSHRARIAPHSILSSSAPIADCSAPDSSPLHASSGLLRLWRLTLYDGLRIAPYAITSRPCVVHGLLRAQHFKLRTGHRLLGVRHLNPGSNCRSLHSCYLASGAARGLLRRQHLEFCIESVVLRIRHLSLRPVRRLLRIRHLEQMLRLACAARLT